MIIISGSPVPRFADIPQRGPLRQAISAATRQPEQYCVLPLLRAAELSPQQNAVAAARAAVLVDKLRAKGQRGPVEALMQEYALSSQEGVALMCLAEALLRIPDTETRDALIRDKIGRGDWKAHLGQSSSIFVNAATWGLVVTGGLSAATETSGLSHALVQLVRRGGEPLVRAGVNIAMKLLGQQFVSGQTIEQALVHARSMEAKGFRYSYDMLGEAAMTASDAAAYLRDYEHAIHAIGQASAGRGIYEGPGISIKLSALHPRYSRAQSERVTAELVPRVLELARLARSYDIGINIDAEESDRLELSLDILETLCADPQLAGWNGIGFVIQAYQKRCPTVVDYLIDLGRRSRRRLMIRLVKGAYWDSEIKRAQIDGVDDYPVFTRKVHTDVSYLACARKLLSAPDAIFPQFATHNAQTLSAIMAIAGDNYYPGQYEFQCLHGMGEALYEEVVGKENLGRPCRIYAPVGTHETLLAYLVRRLLENGANSSFVNRIADRSVRVEDLIASPVAEARNAREAGAPHAKIPLPARLFGDARKNSRGLDLSNEQILADVAESIAESASSPLHATPLLGSGPVRGIARHIVNPADARDSIGTVEDADKETASRAMTLAADAAESWANTPAEIRAQYLSRAADIMESRTIELLGLIIREAGKTAANAVSEVREAVDFLRYYAAQVRESLGGTSPLGPVVCISPWNFPLAIFTGQVSAALAAGNTVVSKPAEETPFIAHVAVKILHEAGIPPDVLQYVPGAGDIGAVLTGHPLGEGVMFTGSTDVARLINRQLATRLGKSGTPIPLIAETGGQNAMIVDSSALAEQVVADALHSAFDSAGQRCSALRVLCVQEDAADRIVGMLKGALAELQLGNPAQLSVDVGPVISQEARDMIETYIQTVGARGNPITRLEARPGMLGHFVPPAIIEISNLAELEREVFGPVLHVLRFRRNDLEKVVAGINATGYGLTFGIHTRLDHVADRLGDAVNAGNIYVNRNTIGATVGVQPFGGHGLSGTGPKAGGPLYLKRLVAEQPEVAPQEDDDMPTPVGLWLDAIKYEPCHLQCMHIASHERFETATELLGPAGERNIYKISPRGTILCRAAAGDELLLQITAALAAGNHVCIDERSALPSVLDRLPDNLLPWIRMGGKIESSDIDAVLADRGSVLESLREASNRAGSILCVHTRSGNEGSPTYGGPHLYRETSISINTAAAGGNASLINLE